MHAWSVPFLLANDYCCCCMCTWRGVLSPGSRACELLHPGHVICRPGVTSRETRTNHRTRTRTCRSSLASRPCRSMESHRVPSVKRPAMCMCYVLSLSHTHRSVVRFSPLGWFWERERQKMNPWESKKMLVIYTQPFSPTVPCSSYFVCANINFHATLRLSVYLSRPTLSWKIHFLLKTIKVN